MKPGRIILMLVIVASMCAVAMAQTSGDVVKVKAGEGTYKVKRGEAAKIEVVLDIDDSYHVHSNRPLDKNLIATTLKLEPVKGLTLTPIIYPKAKLQKFDFSDKPLAVFEGKTVLKFNARALPTLAAGSHTIHGKVTVQACDNERCLRPKTIDVEIPIEVM